MNSPADRTPLPIELPCPVVFFGTDDFSCIPLQKLLDANLPLLAVITKPDSPQNRGHKLLPSPVKVLAEQHGLKVYTPETKKDLIEVITRLSETCNDLIGILCSYGKIIPQEVLDAFEPHGILNIHPSLLPKYRGPSPVETAILNGDPETGVTIIKLINKMDAGPIYAQKSITISVNDSKSKIYSTLGNLGSDLLLTVLEAVVKNTTYPREQLESDATYCKMLDKSLSELKPQEKTATELHNEVRALLGFPKSKLTLLNTPCTITETTTAPSPETPLDPKCADGNYLIIKKLIPENSREMSAREFLSGHH